MSIQTEVRCPKCNSNQLAANKKGFSGKKAFAGAVLTGGIGLLAGTIGSGNVILICLACGKRFKAGNGKVATVNHAQEKPALTPIQTDKSNNSEDWFDESILNCVRKDGKDVAVMFCKVEKGWDKNEVLNYIDELCTRYGITEPVKQGFLKSFISIFKNKSQLT